MHLADLEIKQLNEQALTNRFSELMTGYNYPANIRLGIGLHFLMIINILRKLSQKGHFNLNYVNLPYSEPLELSKGGTLHDSPTAKVFLEILAPLYPPEFCKFADMLINACMVDPYGLIHIPGTRDPKEKIMTFAPGVGDCLGLIIKDTAANITTGHFRTSQQYTPETVLDTLKEHRKLFGATRSCMLALAGLALKPGHLMVIRENREQYPGLQEIDTGKLSTDVQALYPGTDFAFGFYAGSISDYPANTKLLTTDLAASNLLNEQPARQQYLVNFAN